MRHILSVTILMFIAPALRAEPKDIADLFPANTILYAEVNQPGVVGKDLTVYLKGSVFESHAPGFKTLRERQDGSFNTSPSGLIAAMLAPELLKEATQFNGLAGGIVGFDKQGEAEWLFVALPGESKLPGYLLKAFVTARADIRKVTAVEGVDVLQKHMFLYNDDPLLLPGGANPPMPKPHYFGPVYVNHAGLIVVGSNVDLVSAVVRRFKEKEKSAALTTSASFKTLVEERAKPGILVLADSRRLLEPIDRNVNAIREADVTPWLAFKNLLPPASTGTLIARLEIKDDSILLRARWKLEGKSAGPLADLLEGAALSASDLNGIPKSSPFALTIALPEAQRAHRLLNALDATIRATGTLGPNASELFDELESKKLFTRDDIARISRVTIAQPPVSAWAKNTTPLPAIVVHSGDPATLVKLEAAIPQMLVALGGIKSDPISEVIDGVKIRSLEARTSPLKRPIHYGRHGTSLAIGLDRKALAELLRSQPDSGIVPALKQLDKPGMVCVWNWVETTRGPLPGKRNESGPRQGVTFPPTASPYAYHPGMNRPGAIRLTPEAVETLNGLPPLLVSLSRRGNELLLNIEQSDPNRNRTKGLTRLFGWFVHASSNSNNTGGYSTFDGPLSEQPLLLPPPPFPPGQ